jgi:hypothetical protein
MSSLRHRNAKIYDDVVASPLMRFEIILEMKLLCILPGLVSE